MPYTKRFHTPDSCCYSLHLGRHQDCQRVTAIRWTLAGSEPSRAEPGKLCWADFHVCSNALFVKLLFFRITQTSIFLLAKISQLHESLRFSLQIPFKLILTEAQNGTDPSPTKSLQFWNENHRPFNLRDILKMTNVLKVFSRCKEAQVTLPLYGSSRGRQVSLSILSFGKAMSFLAKDAEMGCTNREVRFGRLCLKLPSVFKREKTKSLANRNWKQP